MADFPDSTPFVPTPIFGAHALQSMFAVGWGVRTYTGGVAGSVWPTANLAIHIPIRVPKQTSLKGMWWRNGTVVSGNVQAGIYNKDGVRLASIAPTAHAGTSTYQLVNFSSVLWIGPGLFYMSMVMDNTTGRINRAPVTDLNVATSFGMCQTASAYPLPPTVAFAAVTNDYAPMFGMLLSPRTFL